MKPITLFYSERERYKTMKTNIKKVAVVMDNAIEDVTMEYVKDAGTKIIADLATAGMGIGMYYVNIGFAIYHAAELTTRTAKTGAKKAILKGMEVYNATPAMAVRR